MIMKVGLRRSSINGMFGPYYYFEHIKAVRYAGWTSTKENVFLRIRMVQPNQCQMNLKYIQGTIFRMACFLKK